MILGPTIANAIKVFTPATIAFFVGILIAPAVTNFLYKHKLWKKVSGKLDLLGKAAAVFNTLHKDKEVGTPRMGGTVIWGSVLLTIIVLFIISVLFPSPGTEKLSFLSRNQTWLPLFTMIVGALVGLADDIFEVIGRKDNKAGGLSLAKRLIAVSIMAIAGAWWFYAKLDLSSIIVPFIGELHLGLFFIPVFIIAMLLIYAGGVIDGIDGLAGGVFGAAFTAYGIIAFAQSQIDLAAFCFVIVGSLLAFLWFNIPPARFYMSETGTMALTTTLTVVAFLTEQVGALLIIGFPLIATVASVVLQLLAKKFLGKKVFRVAPIHHHFEAIGWSGPKVTMRYWIISVIFAFLGVILALVGI